MRVSEITSAKSGLPAVSMRRMPMVEAVAVQNVSSHINENKRCFMPSDHHISSATSLSAADMLIQVSIDLLSRKLYTR